MSYNSSVYERLIHAIRSGNNVTVCTASNDTNSDYNTAKSNLSPQKEKSVISEQQEEAISTNKPKQIVIVTKMNENGVPATLPS
ncbi:MAG: hypothetical protein EOP34_00155 [Rickettsiales bacterium]|nr:MAG: hypothetical protein EOP34_00155 [Rickettsiales bacterium]